MTLEHRGPAALSALGQPSLKVFSRYLALWSFAVSHPIYAVLSRSPEFFLAHGTDRASLALTMALLSVGPPVVLTLLELAARRLSGHLGSAIAWGFTTVLAGLASIQFVRLAGLPGAYEIVLALLAGALLAAALIRTRAGRTATLAVASLAVISPALLWFDRNIALAVDSATAANHDGWRGANGTPVVVLVFDQLPTAALLDDERRIDRARWPELARLAETATWYRNATAVSTETIYSVPALLSGKYPTNGLPPTRAAHPWNLFTLLDSSYSLTVIESMTALSRTPEVSGRKAKHRIAAEILVDAAVVYGHLALPQEFRGGLPGIGEKAAFFTHQEGEGRLGQIEDFAGALRGENYRLDYLHHMSPHRPWQMTPTGRVYTESDAVPGARSSQAAWPADPGVTDAARQRYLLQAGEVDWAIGRVVRRLKDLHVFDRTLLIVTSDHGITFSPERAPREPQLDTYLDILYVPLLIKYPGQKAGQASDANAELVDVLPTIADVLGIRAAGNLDGESLRSGKIARGAVKSFQSSLGGSFELRKWPAPGGGEFSRIQPQVEGLTVDGPGAWIRPQTPCDDLRGKTREEVRAYFLVGDRLRARTNRDQQVEGAGPAEFAAGWIVGQLEGSQPFAQEPLIAVSIGGRIEEVCRTFSTRVVSNGFSVLLPHPLSGRSGELAIDVFDPAHPRCGGKAVAGRQAVSALSFSSRDPGDSFGDGWSSVENNGASTFRWATGRRAEVFLGLPKEACEMRIRGATHAGNPDQAVAVKVEGQLVGWTNSVSTGAPEWLRPIPIQADAQRPRASRIELEFAAANAPGGPDDRHLAVGFYELSIGRSPAGSAGMASQLLKFSAADPNGSLRRGWWEGEASPDGQITWRWAVGRRAEISLSLPKNAFELAFVAVTHAGNAPQKMTVIVDGQAVGTVDVHADEWGWLSPVHVPAAANRPPTSRLELEFTKWNRPGKDDPRELAAGFQSLWLYSPRVH